MDIVCNMILLIEDAPILETKWVQSYKPYPVFLTLKELQKSLHMDAHMAKDLFNMGVWMIAYTEHNKSKISRVMLFSKHYMDLQFCDEYIKANYEALRKMQEEEDAKLRMQHPGDTFVSVSQSEHQMGKKYKWKDEGIEWEDEQPAGKDEGFEWEVEQPAGNAVETYKLADLSVEAQESGNDEDGIEWEEG